MVSQNLKEIEESLKQLKKDFNEQLSNITTDTVSLNTAIIHLSSKYPEHADLLEFIIFVNDKIDTKHTIFTEIIIENFNSFVDIKSDLIIEIDKLNKCNIFDSILNLNVFKLLLKNVKFMSIIITIIIISITIITEPEIVNKLIDKSFERIIK